MKNAKKKILPVLVSTVAIVALAMAPALAKDSKNKKSTPLVCEGGSRRSRPCL